MKTLRIADVHSRDNEVLSASEDENKVRAIMQINNNMKKKDFLTTGFAVLSPKQAHTDHKNPQFLGIEYVKNTSYMLLIFIKARFSSSTTSIKT